MEAKISEMGHVEDAIWYLIAECYTRFDSSSVVISSVGFCYIHYHVSQHWERLYQNYLDDIRSKSIPLSIDELACLAKVWQINLQVFDGNRLYFAISHLQKEKTVALANIDGDKNHWQVYIPQFRVEQTESQASSSSASMYVDPPSMQANQQNLLQGNPEGEGDYLFDDEATTTQQSFTSLFDTVPPRDDGSSNRPSSVFDAM